MEIKILLAHTQSYTVGHAVKCFFPTVWVIKKKNQIEKKKII